jgi:DNA repair protein RadA/Sms
MARDSFSCAVCGASHSKWSGRCDACGSWNSIVEEAPTGPGKAVRKGGAVTLTDLATAEPPPPRTEAGVAELDRVLGGGLVAASAVLVGGDPGIGKSTLLLQAAARFARNGLKTLYVTGEESAGQVQMRAQRLGLTESPVKLAAHTNLRDVLATLEAEAPGLAIIDSIQTMWLDGVESAPGSVSQVRACSHELVSFAKRRGTAVILVGHVTKEGAIAGPRVVEHMVDCVLYFEGDRGHQFRILRAVKNRFGPADEIGVFEMTGKGLVEVKNPSALFLADRGEPTRGRWSSPASRARGPSCARSRPSVAAPPAGSARRSVVGWGRGRRLGHGSCAVPRRTAAGAVVRGLGRPTSNVAGVPQDHRARGRPRGGPWRSSRPCARSRFDASAGRLSVRSGLSARLPPRNPRPNSRLKEAAKTWFTSRRLAPLPTEGPVGGMTLVEARRSRGRPWADVMAG